MLRDLFVAFETLDIIPTKFDDAALSGLGEHVVSELKQAHPD